VEDKVAPVAGHPRLSVQKSESRRPRNVFAANDRLGPTRRPSAQLQNNQNPDREFRRLPNKLVMQQVYGHQKGLSTKMHFLIEYAFVVIRLTYCVLYINMTVVLTGFVDFV